MKEYHYHMYMYVNVSKDYQSLWETYIFEKCSLVVGYVELNMYLFITITSSSILNWSGFTG